MDPLQERLARLGLEAIGKRGFALAGGHAVELHGMASRESEDIDLFATDRGSPDEVADNLIAKYASLGFAVKVLVRTRDLVQLEVTDHDGSVCKVDLGVSWSARQPVQLDIGPALSVSQI